MVNYYFDAQGRYRGSAPANPGSLPPANALRVPPPAVPEGCFAAAHAGSGTWEIRPCCPSAAAGSEDADAGKHPEAAVRQEFFRLTRSETYHRENCAHARAAGRWYTLEAIRIMGGGRPCRSCRPPECPPAGGRK